MTDQNPARLRRTAPDFSYGNDFERLPFGAPYWAMKDFANAFMARSASITVSVKQYAKTRGVQLYLSRRTPRSKPAMAFRMHDWVAAQVVDQ